MVVYPIIVLLLNSILFAHSMGKGKYTLAGLQLAAALVCTASIGYYFEHP
jgi:hypothetical protein